MDEDKKLDEEILEKVTGGEVKFVKPVYDPETLPGDMRGCPVCSAWITLNADRVQCPQCGRWFRVEGTTLVEE